MQMVDKRGLHINGEEIPVCRWYPVVHKWSNRLLAQVGEASQDDVEAAVRSAREALSKPTSVHDRYRVLEMAAQLLGEQREELASIIAQEAGKPLKDARIEVDRGQQTLRYSALAARTLHGEEVPIRGNPGSENRLAFTLRKPYGVVLAITPFNFPLNLALHKVGPALASGNSVILKPAPTTPLTALKMAEIFRNSGLRPGWLNVVTGSAPDLGAWLVKHTGVNLVSFTGSAGVGEIIRRSAGLKPVLLELGNNAANIVHRDADLDFSAKVLAQRAFAYAGQVCISVQRIFVDRVVKDEFTKLLTEHTRRLRVGDPEDPTTDVGPMIDERSAERAMAWVEEALHGGGRAILAGRRAKNVVSPWILDNVDPSVKATTEELFAPVVVMDGYDHISEAVEKANNSRYGLQSAVFTSNLDVAFYAGQHLAVGGVIINDSSSYRADNMPYGGIKDSGIGREGPEFAVQEMTYPTTVVLNLRTGITTGNSS